MFVLIYCCPNKMYTKILSSKGCFYLKKKEIIRSNDLKINASKLK